MVYNNYIVEKVKETPPNTTAGVGGGVFVYMWTSRKINSRWLPGLILEVIGAKEVHDFLKWMAAMLDSLKQLFITYLISLFHQLIELLEFCEWHIKKEGESYRKTTLFADLKF